MVRLLSLLCSLASCAWHLQLQKRCSQRYLRQRTIRARKRAWTAKTETQAAGAPRAAAAAAPPRVQVLRPKINHACLFMPQILSSNVYSHTNASNRARSQPVIQSDTQTDRQSHIYTPIECICA